jgi:hypothetical protein
MTQPQFISPPQQQAPQAPPPQQAQPLTRPTLRQLIADSGAGGRYFPFLRIGDSVEGEVVDVKILQARDMISKDLKFWPSGDPMYNVVPTLQTNLRDPQDHEDDGLRSPYVKWGGASRMALQQGLGQAGMDDIVIGCWMRMTYVGDGPAQRGMNAPKLYEFAFRPPTQGAGLNRLPQGAPAAPAQQAQVAPPYPQGYNQPPPASPYATGGVVTTYPSTVGNVTVQGQPGLFTPPPPAAIQYPPPGTPRPPEPRPPAPPTPVPAPVPAAAPAATAGDLAAQFRQIKDGLDAGMTPQQIVLMVPGVEMATVMAIAAAPSQ